MIDLVSSCVGQWKLNDTVGYVIQDSSSAGHLGVFWKYSPNQWGNLSLYTQTGKINSSVYFDTNHYVKIDNHADFNFGNNENFAISLWFKIDSSYPNDYGRMVCKHDLSTWVGYNIFYEGRGNSNQYHVLFGIYTGGWIVIKSLNHLNDGQWHHAVCIRNGSFLYMYIDNVYQSLAGAALGDLSNTNDLYLGCEKTAASNFFKGNLDCVAIYNKALNVEEIGFLYNAGNGTESLTGYEYRGIGRGIERGILRGVI
jgi:hypothetical protein